MIEAVLSAARVPLRRASDDDCEALVALQRAAYADNRDRLGVEPLPLKANYGQILHAMEVWLAERDGILVGALIVEPRSEDFLIWSIATLPSEQGTGIGRQLLSAAEQRARELDRVNVRLYTGTLLEDRVAWYRRHGYVVERLEELSDRSVTHMIKHLGD